MAIRRAIEGRKDRSRLNKFCCSIKSKRGRTSVEILLNTEFPWNGDKGYKGHRAWWVFRINFMDPWKIHWSGLLRFLQFTASEILEFPLLCWPVLTQTSTEPQDRLMPIICILTFFLSSASPAMILTTGYRYGVTQDGHDILQRLSYRAMNYKCYKCVKLTDLTSNPWICMDEWFRLVRVKCENPEHGWLIECWLIGGSSLYVLLYRI